MHTEGTATLQQEHTYLIHKDQSTNYQWQIVLFKVLTALLLRIQVLC